MIVPVFVVRDLLVIRMQVPLTITEAHPCVKHPVWDRAVESRYLAAVIELTVRVLPFNWPMTVAFSPASASISELLPLRR